MHYLSIVSTLVAFIFAVAVFSRYRYKKGKHLLMWGIGLVLYGLGTLTEVILGFTYSPLALRLWYLSGAMLTAAWLGQGTVYLLIRKRGVASTLTAILTLVSLVALGLVFTAPINDAISYNVLEPASLQYQEILTRNGAMVALTIILNIYGTLALVGGALYSAFLFWRKKVLANRVLGNILIAGGALMPAMAGSLVKAGLVDWLYVSELVGVVIMFLGFLQATSGKAAERAPAAASSR